MMYVNVRVKVPFSMWVEVTKWAIKRRIHPVLVWAMMCDHGFGIICDKD